MKHWIVYGLFLGFGFTQAIWMPLVNELYTDLFRNQKETAVALYQIMFSLGNTLVFSFSTALCVYVKLYVLVAELSLGLLIYSIGQYFFSRKSAANKKDVSEKELKTDENQNIQLADGKTPIYATPPDGV